MTTPPSTRIEPTSPEPDLDPSQVAVDARALLTMLLVLVLAVALLFYVLPHWLGTTSVSVNVRPN